MVPAARPAVVEAAEVSATRHLHLRSSILHRFEEIAEVVAIELHSSDRSVELRGGVANHVVGGIACESDEQSPARQLHVEPRTAQPAGKRIRVVIELKAEELRAFRSEDHT